MGRVTKRKSEDSANKKICGDKQRLVIIRAKKNN